MGVTKLNNDVVINSTGCTLTEFIPGYASNIKIQDSFIYTITTNKLGENTNGNILVSLLANCKGILDGRNIISCNTMAVQNGTANDTPRSNMFISIKDVILKMNTGVVSEIIAPMVGNENTQIHYRGTGCTWNSKHPGTNLNGSTIIFEADGDGHIGKHPDAKVDNVKLQWKAKTRNEFVLGLQQNWKNNKPSPMSNLRFVSIDGNDYVSFFTWNNNTTPADINNVFMVNPDWCYDVALPNTKPTSIRRSYRRGTFTTATGSVWGIKNLTPVYLWIDPFTTLDNTGVMNVDNKSFIKNINYVAVGNTSSDNASDIIAYRFKPLIQDDNGSKINNTKIAVINLDGTNNNIGKYDSRIAVSGITNINGFINISEPNTKDYYSSSSYLTDSIVIQNIINTGCYHKWWENDTKMVVVHDTRNSTGITAGKTYSNFKIIIRKEGYIFVDILNTFDTSFEERINLTVDKNYNSDISTSNLSISYSNGITTVTLPNTSISLDAIYKKVIDYHSSISNLELNTDLPLFQNNDGSLTFGDNLKLTFNTSTKIIQGTKIKKLETTQNYSSYVNKIDFTFKDSNGNNLLIKTNTNTFGIYGKNSLKTIAYTKDITEKNILLSDGEILPIVILSKGYKPKLINLSVDSSLYIELTPYTFNGFISNTNVTTIKSKINLLYNTDYIIEILSDLKSYLPLEVLSAIESKIYDNGDNFCNFIITKNTDKILDYKSSKFCNYSSNLFLRLSNTITTHLNKGYTLPIVIESLNSITEVLDNTFDSVKLNSSNILLKTPDYTMLASEVSNETINSIANKVVADVWNSTERTLTTIIDNSEIINILDVIDEKIETVHNDLNQSSNIIQQNIVANNESVNEIKQLSKKYGAGSKLG